MSVVDFEKPEEEVVVSQTVSSTPAYNLRRIMIDTPTDGNPSIYLRIASGKKLVTSQEGVEDKVDYVWTQTLGYNKSGLEVAEVLGSSQEINDAWTEFMSQVYIYAQKEGWIP